MPGSCTAGLAEAPTGRFLGAWCAPGKGVGKVNLIPALVYPAAEGGEAEATIDSTPMIRRLEGEREGRAVVPPDPAVASGRGKQSCLARSAGAEVCEAPLRLARHEGTLTLDAA
jgi:hypothetical protein